MTIQTRAARGGAGALLITVLSVAVLVLAFPQMGRGSGASQPSYAPWSTLADVASDTPSRRVDVIVRMRPGTGFGNARTLVRARGGRVTHNLRLIDGLGARMTAAAAQNLSFEPGIQAVTLASPVRARGVSARRLQSAYPYAVGAPAIWADEEGATGRGVGVAVVDTGIDGELPDFRVSRRNRTSRVRASVVINRRAETATDRHGHGTHVAGIIAGDGNNRPRRDDRRGDYVGIAPDARLISVKVSDDRGRASTLDVIHGIQFAVDHADRLGIRIVNLSLSSTEPSSPATDPLNAAVQSAWLQGLVVVAAAGNDGDAPDAVSYSPGNDPFVITAGATDDQGTPDPADDVTASWSSRGTTAEGHAKPEVLAPGSKIVSTLARDSRFEHKCPECVVDGAYFRAGGTSMATAVVSGGAALLLERHPDWTPDQVKAALAAAATDGGELRGVRLDSAIAAAPDAAAVVQAWPVNELVDPVTGAIDYTAASWRAASWRVLEGSDPLRALWAAASWRCVDCGFDGEAGGEGDDEDGDVEVDPDAAAWRGASWRGASWRTSFTK